MLKRFLVLAFGLVLFVTAFFVHQYWFDAMQVDGKFRAEREKFNVEGANLVSTTPPGPEPLTPTPPPLPVVATPTSADAGTAIPTPSPAPAANAPASVPLDSNTLIVPTPPAATPDANMPGSTPTPAVPATNSTPDSTMMYPGLARLPLLMIGGYATHGPRAQATDAAPAAAATPAPAVSADTNGTATAVPTPAPVPAPAEPISESQAPSGSNASSVIVLGFHQFTPPGVRAGGKAIYTMPQDVFDYEMKYLKDNHFNVVPLSDVVAFAKGEKTLPTNTVAVTIDDGYKSAIVYAAPVLKKYGFPWTFFVYPSFITRTEGKGAASWPDLVELGKEGVDVECHSMTHPNLKSHRQKFPGAQLRDLSPEEYDAFLTDEIVTSKAILEKELGKTIKYFAYPYGNYNAQVQAKAVSAGYEAIFTVADNPVHPGTPVYSMGRYIMTTPVEKLYTSYLRQIALGLVNISPAPGATVTDPRPAVSAQLGYAGKIDPASISANVRDMGDVREDFDPKTSTIRIYLPRDLIDSVVNISVHAKDATTGQTMSASWRFNYQPIAPTGVHSPIGTAKAAKAAKIPVAETNAAAIPASATPAVPATNAPALELTGPGVTIPLTNAGTPADSNAAPAEAAPADSNAAPMTQ